MSFLHTPSVIQWFCTVTRCSIKNFPGIFFPITQFNMYHLPALFPYLCYSHLLKTLSCSVRWTDNVEREKYIIGNKRHSAQGFCCLTSYPDEVMNLLLNLQAQGVLFCFFCSNEKQKKYQNIPSIRYYIIWILLD